MTIRTPSIIIAAVALFICISSVDAQKACYEKARKDAISSYNAEDYEMAMSALMVAVRCSDCPAKNDLSAWIKKVKDKLPSPEKASGYTFGGDNGEEARDILQYDDGSFYILGRTNSYGSGEDDIYLIKTNKSGKKRWEKTYGGKAPDYASRIIKTKDNKLLICGSTGNFNAISENIYLIKIDTSGTILWQFNYGGNFLDYGNSVIQDADGGYTVIGQSSSFGNDKDVSGATKDDIYIIKVDKDGKLLWQQNYGSANEDLGADIAPFAKGGWYALSTVNTVDKGWELNLMKLDKTGKKTSEKNYGGAGWDYGVAMVSLPNDNFVIGGTTSSMGAGGSDMWLFKLDATGKVLWSKVYGGAQNEELSRIVKVKDGGFLLVGSTESSGSGESDMYIVRVMSNGVMSWQKTFGGKKNDYGISAVALSDGGFAIIGYSESFSSWESDIWLIFVDSKGNLRK
ncbi:MAG: hypothetical protein WCM76_10140 [Bacteroidota bacterium]